MKPQQLALPGEVVRKDNRLARAKLNINNLDASRIMANLIACINVSDTDFEQSYSVPVKDFLNTDGGGSYTRIKNICRELIKATVEVEKAGEEIFETYTFFRRIKYEKGVIDAAFNPDLKPLLLQLHQCFTQYNLLEYIALPSIYSQRLFEILMSWRNLPEITIKMTDLHRMLNTPESMKSDFGNFRNRVLIKAHKDITEKTSLKFTWEPIKVGKSVEQIVFYFAEKRKSQYDIFKDKKRKEKMNRINNDRYVRATKCATEKNGKCDKCDNIRIICKTCKQHGILDSVLKRVNIMSHFREQSKEAFKDYIVPGQLLTHQK